MGNITCHLLVTKHSVNSNNHNLIIPYFPVTFHIAADVAATVLTF